MVNKSGASIKSNKNIPILIIALFITAIILVVGVSALSDTFFDGDSYQKLFLSFNSKSDKNISAEPPEPTPEPTPTPTPQVPQAEFEIVETFGVYSPVHDTGEKVIYLTFDDGPSYNVTPVILDTLKEYNVKATFFLLGSNVDKYPQFVQRIYDEGHSLANHSYSHVYKNIYASTESLINEIVLTENSINTALGFDYKNRLFRFPGGSHDKKKIFKQAVYDADFQYIDWNCVGNDSVTKNPASSNDILEHTIKTAKEQAEITVLLHDSSTKMTTAEAPPLIIQHFMEQGYAFKTLP